MGFFSLQDVRDIATKRIAQPAKVSVKITPPLAITGTAVEAKNILAAANPVTPAQAKAASAAARIPAASGVAPSASGGGTSGGGTSGTTQTVSNIPDPAPVQTMPQSVLIQWHDVAFYANASRVLGFSDLSISGSVETEDKENGGTKYISLKNSRGFEVSFKAFFDRRLGIDDVKAEAMKLVDYGATGQTGYLYAQGEKLLTCILMMISAKAGNIIMTPNGTWISCEVTVTLKTCSKLDGSLTEAAAAAASTEHKYSVRVYYSGSSGAVSSVVGYSNVSEDDARKNAWAKVPSTALWASETEKQAANESPAMTEAALETARNRVNTATQQTEAAKSESDKTGITNRYNQVQQKKLHYIN